MNDHKFCFIICTNNDLLLNECIHYINHLVIPIGYDVNLLTIPDATSMTAGYNEAMSSSDAKYKIYMHQDVFLLNKNLISDLLSIFQSDPLIGMIGMVGYDTISKSGIMWKEKRIGKIYLKNDIASSSLSKYRYSFSHDGIRQVALIDGFFMATSKDLIWDTDHLKGFDFYDAFQSVNFLNHNYKIVVPVQTSPWCLHDDNVILNMENYNHYRKIFMHTYPDYLGKRFDEIHPSKTIIEK